MATTEILKKIIAEWLEEKTFPSLAKRDGSDIALEHVSEIIAVAGPRRAGKTCYMYQIIQDLLKRGKWRREDILFVDFEDYRLTDFTAGDTDDLFTAFQQVTGQAPTFLFFDEIQQMSGWSRVLRTLHNQNRYHIVVTGSNAGLLEREIATELRGRCRNILIMPFSFQEFLRFHVIPHDDRTMLTPARGRVRKAFDQYLREGGFPEVVKKETVPEKRELLQTYYRTIFYRDILERYNVKAKAVLEAVMRYSLNTFSDLFSISMFEKEMKRNQLPGSKQTISNYLGYLQEVFFLMAHEKFSYSPRQRVMNPRKIYLVDTGFALLSTAFSGNSGKLLENAVAIEIFRRQVECFYYKGRRECDFIVKKGTKPEAAIQVCWELTPKNEASEFRGLREAMDALDIQEGFVLTNDEEKELTFEGSKIQIMPAWKWLLNNRRLPGACFDDRHIEGPSFTLR
ncbi:MAG TPA: ATP-binding protein [Syntrophorhabdaceae bacterium]|nr:ATP-binding protein [Syntrophorhabdaceae bacterium]